MSPPVRRGPKSSRSSSLASFYNYGPPETDGYVGSLAGESTTSEWSRLPTPRSREGTPMPSPASGPPRTHRAPQRKGPKYSRRVHHNAEATARPHAAQTFLPIPLVAQRPVSFAYANTGTAAGLKQVRFNTNAVAIWPRAKPEYEVIPFGDDPEIWGAFLAADRDRSGLIGPKELRTALVNSPWNKPFEPTTIDMLINIFDLNNNKAIGFKEFVGLSKYVKEWRNEFEKADRNQSGSIGAKELKRALARFGYKLPLKIVKMLHHKHASQPYPKEGEYGITFDQFIRRSESRKDV